MQNADDFDSQLNGTAGEGEPTTNPASMPSIGVKPGWQTSQGQLTAIFTVACLLLSGFGYHSITPDKLQNWYDLISPLLVFILPLAANIPILNTYINSRGKEKSNAIWATAAVNTASQPAVDGQALAATLVSGKLGKFGHIFGDIISNPVTKAVAPSAIGMLPGGAVINKVLTNLTTGQGVPVESLDEAVELIVSNQNNSEQRAQARHNELMQQLLLLKDGK